MKRIKQLIDDNPIYGVAEYDFIFDSELKNQDKTFLSFNDGLKNIKEYIDNNKSFF